MKKRLIIVGLCFFIATCLGISSMFLPLMVETGRIDPTEVLERIDKTVDRMHFLEVNFKE